MVSPWICWILGWAISSCRGNNNTDSTNQLKAPPTGLVAGQHYLGLPAAQNSESGCEGCAEPGEFRFSADGTVEFVRPGSDEIEIGEYTQNGRNLIIRANGKEYHFHVLENGRAIFDQNSKIRFEKLQSSR